MAALTTESPEQKPNVEKDLKKPDFYT